MLASMFSNTKCHKYSFCNVAYPLCSNLNPWELYNKLSIIISIVDLCVSGLFLSSTNRNLPSTAVGFTSTYNISFSQLSLWQKHLINCRYKLFKMTPCKTLYLFLPLPCKRITFKRLKWKYYFAAI